MYVCPLRVINTLMEMTEADGTQGKVLSNLDGEKMHVSQILSSRTSIMMCNITVGANFQFEYELTPSGERAVLGKGTYGVVYSARDVTTQRQIVVKEIEVKYDEEVVYNSIF